MGNLETVFVQLDSHVSQPGSIVPGSDSTWWRDGIPYRETARSQTQNGDNVKVIVTLQRADIDNHA